MKKKKLAILHLTFFTERDLKRYGLNILSKYFDVYLIEIFSHNIKNHHSFSNHIKKEKINYNIISIKDYKSFNALIRINPLDYYIDLMNSSVLSFRIRLLLKRKNTLRIKAKLALLPWVQYKINPVKKIMMLIKKGNFISKINEAILYKIVSKFEPHVDVFLNSGSKSKLTLNYKALEIWTHSYDYQNHLELSELEDNYELKHIGNFALFIDQYAPNHPDYKINNIKPPVSEKNYYKSMNSFFDFFEKKTKLKIVIAGHPSRNQVAKNDWNGRIEIIGKTPQLIMDSSIVLSHYSTALSYAVINKKPIFLITTNEYYSSYRKNQFLAFSEALKIDLINVDKYDEADITDDIYIIDEVKFIDYEEKYIRSKYSSSNDIWHYFSKTLLKIKL
ncbi:hypothetical protein N9L42_02495 [Flavobacteriaceae bacterium]|nr:hypothetical protein [Flavobacteriaceae bacterium]